MNTADDCRLVVNQVGKQYGKKTALSGVSFDFIRCGSAFSHRLSSGMVR